jgi:hypothetical protein
VTATAVCYNNVKHFIHNVLSIAGVMLTLNYDSEHRDHLAPLLAPLPDQIAEIAPYLTQHDADALHDAIYMRLSRVRIRLEWWLA